MRLPPYGECGCAAAVHTKDGGSVEISCQKQKYKIQNRERTPQVIPQREHLRRFACWRRLLRWIEIEKKYLIKSKFLTKFCIIFYESINIQIK